MKLNLFTTIEACFKFKKSNQVTCNRMVSSCDLERFRCSARLSFDNRDSSEILLVLISL